MSINNLIRELKENNQDFEFYPTTKEMIKPIYRVVNGGDWLDIGCGTCNFKKFFEELRNEVQPKECDKPKYFGKYYVIEKSRILLDKLEKDVICLGTNFHDTMLLDKPVQNIFCNPPYSEYEQWACKIIFEANCKNIFLIIPERWQKSENIQKAIKESNSDYRILGNFDFLDAERAARAKVNVVHIYRKDERYTYRSSDLKDYNETAFNQWFDETFKIRDIKSRTEWTEEEEKRNAAKDQLVNAEGSKAKILVDLYNNEIETLFKHFKAISSLDVDILATIGIEKKAVKEALKMKAKGAKSRYWRLAIDELEEITNRLTSTTRQDMFNKFQELQTVDFTIENIYPLILWVIKNANQYYDEQLIDFFKKLSNPESVIKYKSNERVFKRDEWRHSRFDSDANVSHYILDYRIVCDTFYFGCNYSWKSEIDLYKSQTIIDDICTIANNLGFEPVWKQNREYAEEYGKKYTIKCKLAKHGILFEYRVYKNGNVHFKFNKEFAKAMNVEVSRLLGWIRSKEDIKKEFPTEMADGAEKYFKQNYTCIGCNTLLLSARKIA